MTFDSEKTEKRSNSFMKMKKVSSNFSDNTANKLVKKLFVKK